MKKLIVLLLVFAAIFSLASCSIKSNTGDKTEKTTKESDGDDTPAVNSKADLENSNILSTYGYVARADGYTYFVVEAQHNDGRETGYADSNDIYRIADADDAEAEFIAAVPSAIIDGIAQISVAQLTPYGNYVYFLRDYKNTISRVNISTGKIEDIEEFGAGVYFGRSFSRTNDALYFSLARRVVKDGYDTFEYGYKQLDLKTGKISDFTPDLGTKENEAAYIVAIDGGYVYFFKYSDPDSDPDVIPMGIYRVSVKGGSVEEVCPIPNGVNDHLLNDSTMIAVISGDTVYFGTENGEVLTYSVETGKQIGTLPTEVFDNDFAYAQLFNISGDTVYYVMSDGIYSIKNDGTGKERLIEGNFKDWDDILALGVTENHFYFIDDDFITYRTKKDARIISSTPLAAPAWGSDDLKTYNGEWEYYEYPNMIEIHAYVGNASSAEVPASINGKPVARVYLAWDKQHEVTLKSITVPEGVLSIGTLYADGVETVRLPKSLITMSSRGYPYVFETKDGATIEYAGTKAEWQALCDGCDKYVGIDHSGAEDLTVRCSDGIWTPPAE